MSSHGEFFFTEKLLRGEAVSQSSLYTHKSFVHWILYAVNCTHRRLDPQKLPKIKKGSHDFLHPPAKKRLPHAWTARCKGESPFPLTKLGSAPKSRRAARTAVCNGPLRRGGTRLGPFSSVCTSGRQPVSTAPHKIEACNVQAVGILPLCQAFKLGCPQRHSTNPSKRGPPTQVAKFQGACWPCIGGSFGTRNAWNLMILGLVPVELFTSPNKKDDMSPPTDTGFFKWCSKPPNKHQIAIRSPFCFSFIPTNSWDSQPYNSSPIFITFWNIGVGVIDQP